MCTKLMCRKMLTALIVIGVCTLFALPAGAATLYETDFESFSTGGVNGQNGWYGNSSSRAYITETGPIGGTGKSLVVTDSGGDGIASKTFSTQTSNIVVLEFRAKIDTADKTFRHKLMNGSTTVTYAGFGTYSSGRFFVNDGGTVRNLGSYSADTVYAMKIVAYLSGSHSGTYRFYINGTLQTYSGNSYFSFVNSASQINKYQTEGADSGVVCTVDDIRIRNSSLIVSTYIEQGTPLGAYDTAALCTEVKTLDSGTTSTWPESKAVFAARLSHPQISYLFSEYSLSASSSWLGDQGYKIFTCKNYSGLKDVMLVTAPTDIGVLYGIIRINEELEKAGQTDPYALNLNLRDRPMFEYRGVGPYTNYLQYWNNFSCEYFTMEDFPQFFNNTTVYNQWVDGSYDELANLKAKVAEAHRYGKKLYMNVGGPIYPHHEDRRHTSYTPGFRTKIPQMHPEIMATLTQQEIDDGVSQYFCWSSQILKDLVIDNFERIFAEVPELDGVIVSVHNGTGGYLNCHCSSCSSMSARQRLANFLASVATAMRAYNPDARITLRDWRLDELGLSIDTLASYLPSDYCYYSKLTVPPGNDYLWYDHFTPKITTPRLVTIGNNTFHANDSTSAHMFYMGSKIRSRAIAMDNAGAKGRLGGCPKYGAKTLNTTAADESAWDPQNFDPLAHLENWADDSFGSTAGSHVVDAMYGSEKITDFLVVNEYATNSSQFFHWDPDRETQYTQAVEQTSNVKNVSTSTLSSLLSSYGGSDALNRAQNMVDEIAIARQYSGSGVLQQMQKWAIATNWLVKTASNYNMALLYYNLYKNTGSSNQTYLSNARAYIDDARDDKDDYIDQYTSFINDSKQSRRYICIAGEEVEWGYDEVLADQFSLSHSATGSSSLSFSTWQGMSSSSRTWHSGQTLTIPKTIPVNGQFEIPLDADLSSGAVLRVRMDSGTGSWTAYLCNDADIYINGNKIGEIRRRLQGYTVGSKPWNAGHHPPECYRSFVIPAQSGSATIKIVPSGSRSLIVPSMQLRGSGTLPMEGDVTGDGHVNKADAIELMWYYFDVITLNEQQLISADVYEADGLTGEVNKDDVTALMWHYFLGDPIWQEEYDLGITIPPQP
ncbi:MAG: hypothetical protein K8R02_03795 [Anaerohalosphaeraceae bacterium]|nr:hypothetical protein [Anaerohalosphaeraceae bacterium]